jgi:hypothetical protein
VAAVATILGLLLVVTVMANYLATQLPEQMAVNDADHELTVQNQLSQLAATLRLVSAAGAVGAEITQPVSLGSAGAPPFAAPDGAQIERGAQGSGIATSLTVTAQSSFAPPTVGPAGGTTGKDACTTSSTSLSCSGTSRVVWNFTSASPTTYSLTTSGGPYYLNVSASRSSIALSSSSSVPVNLLLVGNNDSVNITISGSSSGLHVIVIGSYDVVQFVSGSWSTSTVSILFVGDYDTVDTGTLSMTGSQLTASFFGADDTVTLGTVSASSSGIAVYFNGFSTSAASSKCPSNNLAEETDSVGETKGSAQSGGTYTVTYNDTSVSTGPSAPSPWTATYAEPTPFACPYYGSSTFPLTSSTTGGGSLLVTLRNVYSPTAVVGFDLGAVVFAQVDGVPVTVVAPGINFVSGTLTLWVPQFVGAYGTEVGTGTAELSARLLSLLNVSLPAGGYGISGTTSIAVTTSFAAAWVAALGEIPALAGDVSCVPATSAACAGSFQLNGPLATVYVNVTATALALQLATFGLTMS